MGAAQQAGVIRLGEALAATLAGPAIQVGAVDQPRPLGGGAGPGTDQRGDRDALAAWAVTFTTGVRPRRPQVRPFGGFRPWPDSSSKQSQAPRSAAVLLSPARSPPATWQSGPRPARPPGAPGPARSSRSGA